MEGFLGRASRRKSRVARARLIAHECAVPQGSNEGPLPFSNRYNKLLESPVTRTKQTTASRSNRYKSTLISGADGKRLSCPLDSSFQPPVSNRPHPRLEIIVTCTKQRVGPVSNRPYFAILFSPRASGFRNARSAPGSSNRYNKLLECPASRTKQTIAPRSNRYKSALISRAADGRNRLVIRAACAGRPLVSSLQNSI